MRSPRTQKPRSQQWPEYQDSPPEHKNKEASSGPRIRRARGLPHTPTYRRSPKNTKETLPRAARVSADPGIYPKHQHAGTSKKREKQDTSIQASPPTKKKNQYQKAARMSADPAVCLRGRHTGKSKKRQRNAAQKGNKSLPKPAKASTDPGVYLKGQHTGQ